MILSYGSVCSGIEAATVAWDPVGFKPAWFAEIEKFPSQVLAHHYPTVPNLGDMTKIASRIASGEVEAPDVLVGGTPCQAYSVAGLRGGMADPRGALTLSFVTLGDEIDRTRKAAGLDECVIVWENVPGVLSSKDNAFGCFLASLAGESQELQPSGGKWANAGFVIGPKRQVAWRIMDAQFFGVAQRRRRVFVVASARNGLNPLSVLFEFEGLRRDIAPSRNERKEVTELVGTLAASGGGLNRPAGNANELDFCVASYTLAGFASYVEGVGTLKAHGGDLGGGSETLVGALCARTGLSIGVQDAEGGHLLSTTYGIPGNWINRKPENGGNAVEPMHIIAPCLTKTDQHGVVSPAPATAFKVRCGCEGGGKGYLGSDDLTFTLSTGHDQNLFTPNMQVRRLTPVECERLQGFPDNYTNIPGAVDSPRYKALGNSMAVPVMRWLGVRIYLSILGLL